MQAVQIPAVSLCSLFGFIKRVLMARISDRRSAMAEDKVSLMSSAIEQRSAIRSRLSGGEDRKAAGALWGPSASWSVSLRIEEADEAWAW